MPRYLVRFEPDYKEEVRSGLGALGIVPVEQVFDYFIVDVPEEVVLKIRKIPHVVEVRPEVEKRVAQYVPVPVDKKMARFFELAQNPLTLPQAISYTMRTSRGKTRWPTSSSREVLGAHEAEEEGYTGKGIKLAVLDTGVDPTISQCPMVWGESSQTGQPLPLDENGHGTHCLTTACGGSLPTPWGMLKGVAPDAETSVFKCLGYGAGAGSESGVMRAMMDAFRWGADIISMSLGSPYAEEGHETIPECRAIEALTERGDGPLIFSIANGNDGSNPRTVGVAANSPYAVSVGAIDIKGEVAGFSSRGPTYDDFIKPDVIAPGVDILSSTATASLIDNMEFMDGPRLAAISGTSMATPHISGMLALIKQLYRENDVELTSNMVKDMMERYGESKTNDRGWGLLTWSTAERYLKEAL